MKLLQNKRNLLVLILAILVFSSALLFRHNVNAVGTKKVASYYVNNGSGSVYWHSQGATLTKDYYIWTDWKKSNGPTYIVMCKRSNPKSCTRSGKKDYGHASTLHHKWGTDYFLIKAGSTIEGCWSISKKKEVSTSNCKALKNELKIGNPDTAIIFLEVTVIHQAEITSHYTLVASKKSKT